MRRRYLYAVLFIIVLLTDQVPKLLVSSLMPYGQAIPVIGDFLMIRYVHNPGTVFGMFTAWPGIILVLKAIGVTVITALTLYYFTSDGLKHHGVPDSVTLKSALIMICASGIGNFIDRIRIGAVIDFIDAGIGSYRWYIFNPADAYLVIGAILVFYATLMARDTETGADSGAD